MGAPASAAGAADAHSGGAAAARIAEAGGDIASTFDPEFYRQPVLREGDLAPDPYRPPRHRGDGDGDGGGGGGGGGARGGDDEADDDADDSTSKAGALAATHQHGEAIVMSPVLESAAAGGGL